MSHRVYVRVLVEYDEEGGVHPKKITWEDGRCFSVERVLDVRRAAATKAGGQGIRYTCRIPAEKLTSLKTMDVGLSKEKNKKSGLFSRKITYLYSVNQLAKYQR